MVSEMAMEDAEALEAEGTKLTPREVVRLNAFGLRAEKNAQLAELSKLPRCAQIGDVVFVEPCIGAELWLEQAGMLADLADPSTYVAMRALQCMTPWRALPELNDIQTLRRAVSEAKDKLSGFTLRQVLAALNYILNGADERLGELAPEKDAEADEPEPSSEDISFTAGVLSEGVLLELGPPDELKGLTSSHVRALIAYKSAMRFGRDKGHESRALGEYYAVLEEIKKAHAGKESDEQADD